MLTLRPFSIKSDFIPGFSICERNNNRKNRWKTHSHELMLNSFAQLIESNATSYKCFKICQEKNQHLKYTYIKVDTLWMKKETDIAFHCTILVLSGRLWTQKLANILFWIVIIIIQYKKKSKVFGDLKRELQLETKVK